jgi:hypothetical protein
MGVIRQSVHTEMNSRKTGGFLQFRRIPVVLSISRANVVVFFGINSNGKVAKNIIP